MTAQPATLSLLPIPTRRLRLRPLTPSDAEAVTLLRTDPRIFFWRAPDTPHAASQWLTHTLYSPLGLNYAITLIPALAHSCDAEVIGLIGFSQPPEVGYILHPDVWGHGFATEALTAWMRWYWETWPGGHPGLEDQRRQGLEAVTGVEDERSAGVLRKCGFGKVGTEKDEHGEVVRWRAGRGKG